MSFFCKSKYYKPQFGGSLLIILVLILGGGMLGAVVTVIAGAITGDFSAEGLMSGKLSLLYFAQMIVPVLFIWLMGHVKSQNPMEAPVKVDAPHLGKFNWLTLGILLMLVTLSLAWILDPVTEFFPMPDSFKQMFDNISSSPVDTIVSVAIMAPLFEEFVLRGTIERGLLARKGDSRKTAAVAILWSAFLFGVIHLNLWQAIPAFVIGCLLGWVYYRTHSIWATIFMHFVNNFSSIALFWAIPAMDADATSRENFKALTGSDMYYWIIVGGGVVITIVGIWLLDKYLPKNPQSFKPKETVLAEQMPFNGQQPFNPEQS
ncbi:MAG: CPBP family intramembrane metalloprotease [Bacteroidales bacterium]|jgi:membrane protease YdiL (CAAX protease family)|nr:CPBP family intramembrane metalloprotease [Bacteroidales bacterium]